MLQPDVQPLPYDPTANWLRQGANALSMSRVVGGVTLGICIGNSEYPLDSWWPSIATTGFAATDWADGYVARQATKRDGQQSRFGKWIDQLTDKAFVTSVIAGVACANFAHDRVLEGTVIAASGAVIAARDAWVTWRRIKAEQANVTVNTGAQWPGKVKTAVQLAALTVTASPLMESPPVNMAATSVLAGSAVLAVTSGVSLVRSLDQQLQQNPSDSL